MRTDAIVEVLACYFPKGYKTHASEIEYLVSGTGPSWEDASDVIPEENRDPFVNLIGQEIPDRDRPDSIFNQDWIGFDFVLISECNGDDFISGAELTLQECGPEETFGPFRKELLEMVKAEGIGPERKLVRILTAWSYWSDGQTSPYTDDFDDGITLQGRLDMENVAVRK